MVGVNIVASTPPSWLGPWVERLWVMKGGILPPADRILPAGVIDIVFNLSAPIEIIEACPRLGGRVVADSFVNGLKTQWVTIRPLGEVWHAGVQLKPAGAAALLGVPLVELTDQVVPGDVLLGRGFSECRDRLAACRTPGATFACLLQWLERGPLRGAAPSPLAGAVAALGHERVEEVARGVGVTARQLGRRFRKEVGVCPKQLAAILRFRRSVERLHAQRAADLAAVAQEAGYFDQSHFTREFRRFAGMTPGEYQRRERALATHVPVSDSYKTPARIFATVGA